VSRRGLLTAAAVVGVVLAVRGVAAPHRQFAGSPRVALTAVCSSVFVATLLRAALRDRARRGSLGVLLVAVALWSGAALRVAVRGVDQIPQFPATAKVLILLAYVGFAGYVLLDVGVGRQSTFAGWLEVVVICGGTASLATSVLLLPVHGTDVGSAVLALLVPLLDVMLVFLILAQVGLRIRRDLGDALQLAAGFALLAFADARFVSNLSSGTQTLGLLSAAARVVGFALIVSSACRPGPIDRVQQPRIGGLVFAAATATAVAALALRPGGELAPYVVVPAVLTLGGAAGRLMLALHEARRAGEALARSHTDDITNLPNRRALRARIDKALAGGSSVALIVLDLDGFKDINDTLGHTTGDGILQQIGVRIREAVPALASVARLGGDEFGILTPRGDSLTMMDTAQEVLDALGRPLRVDGIDIALSASVGIVDSVQDEGIDSNELVRRAEVAMYRAKHARSGIALYDPVYDDYSKAKLRVSEQLRRGIHDGELEVWYQPQIDASTLRPCALEALVRWRHPTDGLLSPVEFLSAARRAGLMPLLSQEVVRIAVADVARWHAAGLRLRVAINCAPPELLSGVFVPRLHQAMREANLPPDGIVLEVTEESFIAEPERAREILEDVRAHGIRVAIDDYGTGFSSLAYLRDLPVDELKLDRSFVSPIGSDERSRMIVSSTVQMARALGMRTVAEGVEDAATAADLIAIGVDALQGYHISRPIPAGEVIDWIVQWPSFADVRLTVGGAAVADAMADDAADELADELAASPATRTEAVPAPLPRRAPRAEEA
jgi:diguanylate cyclase (GGDEF)-like protein